MNKKTAHSRRGGDTILEGAGFEFGKADLLFSPPYRQGGCGQSFEAKIVSPLFAKKTTLARHRLVNAALKTEIAAIHAWTPRCFTPEEWEKKKANAGIRG